MFHAKLLVISKNTGTQKSFYRMNTVIQFTSVHIHISSNNVYTLAYIFRKLWSEMQGTFVSNSEHGF